MEELKSKTASLKKSLLITFFYFVIVSICAFFHEVWCDEAQVWMLVKHLSIPELLKHLINEGHPSLFYLLIMPFAKLSDNFIFQKLICLLSSAGAIFLLWRYSKFNNITKTIITLSAPFIYYFPVVCRNYSLIPIIIFSIAILYNKNKEHPIIYSILIALLANTHAIMLGISGLLGLEFIYKNIILSKKEGNFDKKFILPSVIIFLGIFALLLQLLGTTNSNAAIGSSNDMTIEESSIRVLMLFVFNSFDEYVVKTSIKYFNPYTVTMFLFSLISGIIALYYLFKKSAKLFVYVVLSVVFQLLIYILLYPYFMFPTRIYCAYMIFLFAFWVVAERNSTKLLNVIISIIFALTFINSFKSYYGDIVFDYSGSKRAAQFIKHNTDLEKSIFYIDDSAYGLPINFYLYPNLALNSTKGEPIKYVIWKKEYVVPIEPYQLTEFYKVLRKRNPKKDLYMITKFNPYIKEDSSALDEEYFELLYVSPFNLTNSETVKIWKYKK